MPANFKKKKHQRKHNKNQSHQEPTGQPEPEDTADGENGASQQTVPVEENNNVTSKPYAVRHSDVWGRYLVASRSLKAGEKIIEVEPLAVGPWAESDPVCLGCYKPFPKGGRIVRCDVCAWRICSTNCHGLSADGFHKQLECIPLSKRNVAKQLETATATQLKQAYEAIFALRCMLLKQSNPNRYAQLLEMEPLNELRQQNTTLWKRNQESIVQRIRDEWKFEEFSEQEIHTVCGIIEVNCFQIGPEEVHARALYPEAFYIMHDCTPNTTHTDDPRSHVLTVRPTINLKEGDPLTLTYSYTLQGTLKRRQHLYESKFFYCKCARCSDPTELGTHCSTLRCAKCPQGLVLPTDPLDQTAVWKCQLCSHSIPAQNVTQLLDRLFKELDSIDGNSVHQYENFIVRYEPVLHHNHYLFLSAKHSLCQLYGKIADFLLHELSLDQIKHKEALCRDLLLAVDRFEPGLSRLRGHIMYELHAPIMIEARYRFETKQITASQLRLQLREVTKLLRLSAEILGFEPAGSPEHEMSLAAQDAMREMKA